MSTCTCNHSEEEHDGPGGACSRCMCMYYEEQKDEAPKHDEGEVWRTKVWCANRFPNCVFAAMLPPLVPVCQVSPSQCECHRQQQTISLSAVAACAMAAMREELADNG